VTDLERQLIQLGSLLQMPAERDLASAVIGRVRMPSARRWRVPRVWTRRSVAVAVAASLVASGIAVAAMLGVRGVRIRVDETPPATQTHAPLHLGRRLELSSARDEVDFEIGVPAELGAPDEAYLTSTYPGSIVALLYLPRPSLPDADASGAGLLLFQFEGEVDATVLEKWVRDDQVTQVHVGDSAGLWIEGAHTIAWRDRDGGYALDTVRLAENVLLWQQGAVTFRLESALPLPEALRIAASVR